MTMRSRSEGAGAAHGPVGSLRSRTSGRRDAAPRRAPRSPRATRTWEQLGPRHEPYGPPPAARRKASASRAIRGGEPVRTESSSARDPSRPDGEWLLADELRHACVEPRDVLRRLWDARPRRRTGCTDAECECGAQEGPLACRTPARPRQHEQSARGECDRRWGRARRRARVGPERPAARCGPPAGALCRRSSRARAPAPRGPA
jgi:hypothetical protein